MRSHLTRRIDPRRLIRGSGDENDLFFKAGELNARMSGLFLIGLFSTRDLPLERT